MVTTASTFDQNMVLPFIDSMRDCGYVMIDEAYDSYDVYDYAFNNTKSLPVIDTNRRSILY